MVVNWAVKYGSNGYSMALSGDEKCLIACSFGSSSGYIGKLNSSDGSVLKSLKTAGQLNFSAILCLCKNKHCASHKYRRLVLAG